MGPQSRYSGDCTRRLRMDTGSRLERWSTRVFVGEELLAENGKQTAAQRRAENTSN